MQTPAEQNIRRKVSAVLMADVVGYSALMQNDEQRTHKRLQSCFETCISPSITDRNGRLIRRMGDGFLACFDSATEAVDCAMQMQKLLHDHESEEPDHIKLRMRIGVNLGEVIHQDDDIFGDGVNIAARLQAIAPPGGVLVSEFAYREARRNLDFGFEFEGRKQLKNISGQVSTYLVTRPSGAKGSAVLARPTSQADLSRLPTIAVLAFENLGVEKISNLFIDGFVDELITDLARFRTLSVIARTSSFRFRGSNNTATEIGQLLGAQYIVEGAIRQVGDAIRINVQLIDVNTDSHIWAERFEGPLDQTFAVQDQIISEIVGALERSLVMERLENVESSPIGELSAYDLWLRANKLMDEWSSEADAQAIPLMERALSIDPKFARAHSGLAAIYNCRNLLYPGNPNNPEDLDLGYKHAKQAVALGPGDARNQLNLSWSYMLKRDFRRAAKHFDLAEKLNPHDADILISLAVAFVFLGLYERGLEAAERAVALNPFHPDFYLGNLVIVRFLAGKYAEAADTAEQIPTLWPEIAAWLAASQALAGNADKAKAAGQRFLSQMRRLWAGPQDSCDEDFVRWIFEVNAIKQIEDRERLLKALISAGLPRIERSQTAPKG